MGRLLTWAYLAVVYGFIFLPVAVLVLFSFQDGRLPVPPFKGPTLRWYAEVLGDRDLMAALGNSFLVALLSSGVALLLGFLAAHGLAVTRVEHSMAPNPHNAAYLGTKRDRQGHLL